jgi:hypothetical protein
VLRGSKQLELGSRRFSGKDSSCAHDGGGGSARRCIAGAHVLATRASFGLRHLAQDDQGNDVVLPEGLNGPEKQRKMVGDEGRAARTGGARGGRRCRGLRASGHRGSTRGDPAKILQGLGRSGDHRRQSNLVETELTAAIKFGRDRAHRQWRSWENSTARASWVRLGLRSRFREVTGEAAWCLRGGRVALCVCAADPTVKADRAKDLRNPRLWGSASRR